MKKFAALLFSLSTLAAVAAGPYDGIYQHPTRTSNYASVHQNGNSLIIALFDTMPASGVRMSTESGAVMPTRFDFWDLYQGAINGNLATMSGQTAFGGCVSTFALVFDAAGHATATFTSVTATALGTAQGLNCASGTAVGSSLAYTKVF